jgi:hypothetical protein
MFRLGSGKRREPARNPSDKEPRTVTMTGHHLQPQTTLRRYKDGSGWYLETVGDDGVAENIGDFSSEAEAQDWIVHKSAAFFNARMR